MSNKKDSYDPNDIQYLRDDFLGWNVDADTGGYNFQACWSTDRLAGVSAAMG